MKHRLALITLATAMALAVLASCSDKTDSTAENTAGATAGTTSPMLGGTGGMGTGAGAGVPGAAGVSAAGMGGMSAAGVGGAGMGGSSAGSGGSTSSAIPPTFETVKLVLQGGGAVMPCSAAPCHGVNGVAPPDDPLELPPNDDQQLYTNLTTYVSKACGDIKLVDAGNPDQSAILKILSGPCGMTPRMPYMCSAEDGNCIPDEYVAAIRQWIANGAPQQ